MYDWKQIRHDYETTSETVIDICGRHNLSQRSFYRKASAQDWPKRNGRPRHKPNGTIEGMIERLYRAYNKQVSEFEKRYASSIADETISEKDARTLSSLARTLEKLISLKTDMDTTNLKQDNDQVGIGEGKSNIEHLRKELAERINRLRKQQELASDTKELNTSTD